MLNEGKEERKPTSMSSPPFGYRSYRPRAASVDDVRVNVLRNGSDRHGVVLVIPESMHDFFDACAELCAARYKFSKVWNAQGFEILDVHSFVPSETVFVGTQGESFLGTSSRFGSIGRILRRLASQGRIRRAEEESESDEESEHEFYEENSASDDVVFGLENEGENIWMDSDFDISTSNLQAIFSELDTDNDGFISYAKFRRGLEEFNLTRELSDNEFQRLLASTDLDKSGNITRSEFVKALQNLVISARFIGEVVSKIGVLKECFVYDYCVETCRFRSTLNQGQNALNMKEFLGEPPGPREGFAVRWINVTGNHLPTLYGIASIYDLNNFEVEDALSKTERSRIVYHNAAGSFSLDNGGHVQAILRWIRQKHPRSFKVKDDQLSIFCTMDTVITVQETSNDVIMDKVRSRLSSHQTPLGLPAEPRKMISKIRRNGSEYLVYFIIDQIVDHAYGTLFNFNKDLLRLERTVISSASSSPQVIHSVLRIKREIMTLRDALLPMMQAIFHLRDNLGKRLEDARLGADEKSQELERHLVELYNGYNDISDHSSLMSDQIRYLTTWYANV